MKFGRARFYADENVDHDLITWLRGRKFHVQSAQALGYKGRDDRFHLQEAARPKCVLLTDDRDYLDRSEEHTSELQSQSNLVCRLLLEKKTTTPHPGARYPIPKSNTRRVPVDGWRIH